MLQTNKNVTYYSCSTVSLKSRLFFVMLAFILVSYNFVFASSLPKTKLTVLIGAASQARPLIVFNSSFQIVAKNTVFSGITKEEASNGNWIIKTFELDSSLLESDIEVVVRAKRRSSGFLFNSGWESKRYTIPINRDLLASSRRAIAIEFIKSDRFHKSVVDFRVTSFDDYVELQQIRSIEESDSKFAAALVAGLKGYSKGLQENSQKNQTIAVNQLSPVLL